MMLHIGEFLDQLQHFQKHNLMNIILQVLKEAEQCYSHGDTQINTFFIGAVSCMIRQEVALPFFMPWFVSRTS